MSRYLLVSNDPEQRLEIGFERHFGGFYWAMRDPEEPTTVLSEPDSIVTLHDLVAETWGWVDWENPMNRQVLRALADDCTWRSAAPTTDDRDREISEVIRMSLLARTA